MTLRSNASLKSKSGQMCYAIHPLSVMFSRDYTNTFILYFQKDLAILSRFQLIDKVVPKEQRYYFDLPTQIQTFKFQSEKDLQFKWSLYIQRVSDNYQHEQYMECKKSNLRWCWDVFQRYENRTNSVQVNFGVVKLRLTFLFVIGHTPTQLIRALQSYYKQQNIVPTKKIEESRRNRDDFRKKQTLPESIRMMSDSNVFSEITQEHEARKNQLASSSEIQHSAQIVSPFLRITGRDSPLGLSKIDINDLGTTKRVDSESPTKIKRTLSEIEISKDIERMVAETEEYIRNTSKSLLSGSGQKSKSASEEFYQNQKWISSSQYLNKRGELVIVPFYTQIKYWLIIILICIIFLGLMQQGPQSKPFQIPNIRRKTEKTHSRNPKQQKSKGSHNPKKGK